MCFTSLLGLQRQVALSVRVRAENAAIAFLGFHGFAAVPADIGMLAFPFGYFDVFFN